MGRASYLNLFEAGMLEEREQMAWARMHRCDLCPHECGVDRTMGRTGNGYCRTGKYAVVNSYAPHHGEEKPIRGVNGSGTIFIANCNMGCVFCQNHYISQSGEGVPVLPDEIAKAMVALQEMGCHNLNLVTPSHIIPQFLSALVIAAGKGFSLPILDGVVDIYMPDLKYGRSKTAQKYSGIRDYAEVSQAAVKEMYRQVGDLEVGPDGVAARGLLVRHLMMPGMGIESEIILRFIVRSVSEDTYINLMTQFRPEYLAGNYPELNRWPEQEEFDRVRSVAFRLGLRRLD
jgi:putative pyruvate formate lyase activating enzyme